MDKRSYIRKYFLDELIRGSNGKCFYCGKPFYSKKEMTIDHIVPLSDGGKDVLGNLILACVGCNARKDSLPLGIMFESKDRLLQATKEYLNLSSFEFVVLKGMRKIRKFFTHDKR